MAESELEVVADAEAVLDTDTVRESVVVPVTVTDGLTDEVLVRVGDTESLGVWLSVGVTVGVGELDGGAIAYSLYEPSLALLDPPM